MTGVTEGDYVLLGVIDEAIPLPQAHFSVNKVGGKPDFFGDRHGSPICEICGKVQSLAVQVYCPLDDSPCHRVLYVFCCLDGLCWSKSHGWTVLRVLIRDEKYETKYGDRTESARSKNWGGDDDNWGGDEDDWGEESNARTCTSSHGESSKHMSTDTHSVEVLTSEISNLIVEKNDQSIDGCKLAISNDVLIFKSYYINVFDESECARFSKEADLPHTSSLSEVETADDCSNFGGGCKVKPEYYERSERSDNIFHKFWKKNRICPEQVIRYSHAGNPLPARKFDEKIPHCSCGAARKYEMQLMPALLPFLVLNDVSVEFSTVLIYTCSANCSQADRISFLKEHVVYQDDPDLSYFKGQKS